MSAENAWRIAMEEAAQSVLSMPEINRQRVAASLQALLMPPAFRAEVEAEVAAMRARKDAAYEERNRVVAALARLFPSGTKRTDIPGWDDEWHGCVYIDTPAGQLSWHFHDSQAHLFADLPAYSGDWDGHDTPEKYCRLAAVKRAEVEGEELRQALGRIRDETLLGASHGLGDRIYSIASGALSRLEAKGESHE